MFAVVLLLDWVTFFLFIMLYISYYNNMSMNSLQHSCLLDNYIHSKSSSVPAEILRGGGARVACI